MTRQYMRRYHIERMLLDGPAEHNYAVPRFDPFAEAEPEIIDWRSVVCGFAFIFCVDGDDK